MKREKMKDNIIKFQKSLIQHGKVNDRVYLMKLGNSKVPQVIEKIEELAAQNSYSKIFVKIPEWAKAQFHRRGYLLEAKIPKFYDGQVTAFFMGKYPVEDRKKNPMEEEIKKIIGVSRQKSGKKLKLDSQGLFQIKKLKLENADMIAGVFKAVFETYPFPIHDAGYIKDTMRNHIEYFGAWKDDELIAVSSAEKDSLSKSVEMTDFATLPEHRGENIALRLLAFMEKAMTKKGYKTAYTIARALSYGMNITFAKAAYRFGGTLINNTNICGKIESMNVWHKPLK